MKLYPLKFEPILKNKLWGGEKLGSILDKPIGDRKDCGESWEISGVEGDVSIVANGQLRGTSLVELIQRFKGNLIGTSVYQKFGNTFPLLIKFIDANDDLSIQVHPDDKLAQTRHNSFGKTEMWYVVNADERASLISGFNRPTNKKEYLQAFESGKLSSILNKEEVYKDDVFFLPAGRVHTIGKGLLIAEIQQTSDITYRIYDFDRVDSEGKQRELHVEEALDAIDFTFYDEYKTSYDKNSVETELVKSSYFITNRLVLDQLTHRDYSRYDSCIILMCLEGQGDIKHNEGSVSYNLGDSILVPNAISTIDIAPKKVSTFLEVRIPV